MKGCRAGAWLQVACKLLGDAKNGGRVMGIDIKVQADLFTGLSCCSNLRTAAVLQKFLSHAFFVPQFDNTLVHQKS